jgi:hypothetical protein
MSYERYFGGFAGHNVDRRPWGGLPTFANRVTYGHVAPQAVIRAKSLARALGGGARPPERQLSSEKDPPYSAATGCASAHSSGRSSSLRFGKKSAQPSVTTEKTASTVVTAATLPVRS